MKFDGLIFLFCVTEEQVSIIPMKRNVTLQHKTSHLGQILESEIWVLCDSVLQELSTNIFDIIIQMAI
jgi:hypothetical protein